MYLDRLHAVVHVAGWQQALLDASNQGAAEDGETLDFRI